MAQLVEHSAVNRQVLGSIPSEGASFFLCQIQDPSKKKLLVGESNPGRPRDRRKCYQLHQPGLEYLYRDQVVLPTCEVVCT